MNVSELTCCKSMVLGNFVFKNLSPGIVLRLSYVSPTLDHSSYALFFLSWTENSPTFTNCCRRVTKSDVGRGSEWEGFFELAAVSFMRLEGRYSNEEVFSLLCARAMPELTTNLHFWKEMAQLLENFSYLMKWLGLESIILVIVGSFSNFTFMHLYKSKCIYETISVVVW